MPRKNFPAKVRKAVFLRAGGCCEKCRAVLKKGEGEVDHIIPDALGGEPVLANAMLLCRVCHRGPNGKTKDDVGKIAQAKARQARDLGIKRPAGKLRGPGFPKRAKPEREQRELPRRALYREDQP